jgi:condensin complex subunit 1
MTTQVTGATQAPKNRDNAIALSQLLFIVGHVAIKQIVHLELCELDFKRRKQEKEKLAADNKDKEKDKEEGDELDLIGGTSEDDFTEAMAHIRERELLYGPTSLLGLFGPLVSEICANNTTYADKGLQAAATLCLAKLMCVSSEYCETNLPLLITIMERSPDATVRSNAVIALGDMAVCFNHLIDENTDFLYRRLADNDASVKRTCLMTLTFLILAGQVKVKGQLGEMAKCLEDEDRRIADLARMFFTELSTKDNAVYNHFVDMFSLLSAAGGNIEQESFRRIVKFLLGFVEKVSPIPSLVEYTRLSLYQHYFSARFSSRSSSLRLMSLLCYTILIRTLFARKTGQARQAAVRETCRETGALRDGEAVGRRGVCSGTAAAQERRYRQDGVGGFQAGAGGCLDCCCCWYVGMLIC